MKEKIYAINISERSMKDLHFVLDPLRVLAKTAMANGKREYGCKIEVATNTIEDIITKWCTYNVSNIMLEDLIRKTRQDEKNMNNG